MDKRTLSQLSSWMGFVGIMTIIAGVISAIAGVFAFVIGAIPGIIAIVLGVKLRNAKHNADILIAGADDQVDLSQFNLFASNLTTYFKIQGILIIISLVMGFLGALISMVVGLRMFI